MAPFFCANAQGEDLIGTAGHYQTYILIECPTPWATSAFNSKPIPSALRDLIRQTKAKNKSIQFLCIDSGITLGSSQPSATTRLLIYEKEIVSRLRIAQEATEDFFKGYRGYEFELANLDQVAPCLDAYWQGSRIGRSVTTQDWLVCTHGMRDKCCARFGQPFFRQAKAMAEQCQLPNNRSNVRIWKVSHIGGHRFAPTAISLPDGRYYGKLTAETFKAIALRHFLLEQLPTEQLRIEQILPVYRGWGMLPTPLQALERYLWLKRGWSWLDCSVAYRLVAENAKRTEIEAELLVQPPAETICQTYRAKLRLDPRKTQYVKASCGATRPSLFLKYGVVECALVGPATDKLPSNSPSTTASSLS